MSVKIFLLGTSSRSKLFSLHIETGNTDGEGSGVFLFGDAVQDDRADATSELDQNRQATTNNPENLEPRQGGRLELKRDVVGGQAKKDAQHRDDDRLEVFRLVVREIVDVAGLGKRRHEDVLTNRQERRAHDDGHAADGIDELARVGTPTEDGQDDQREQDRSSSTP